MFIKYALNNNELPLVFAKKNNLQKRIIFKTIFHM